MLAEAIIPPHTLFSLLYTMNNTAHISGGDEADGVAGDGNGFGGDEEDDYGYKNHIDDDDASDSEQEPDLADDGTRRWRGRG